MITAYEMFYTSLEHEQKDSCYAIFLTEEKIKRGHSMLSTIVECESNTPLKLNSMV